MTFAKSSVASASLLAMATVLLVFSLACGGGGGSSSSSSSGNNGSSSSALSSTCANSTGNCVPLTTNNSGYVNGAFTSVTVCTPGSTTACATVSGVLVDTGSVGLRLFKSQVSAAALTPSTFADGHAEVECYPFVASYIWGPVAAADIKVAGETASSAPVMLIDDSTTPAYSVPAACSDYDGMSLASWNTLSSFGANGIIGIGSTQQDCGSGCNLPVSQQLDSSNQFVGLYYDCASQSSCTGAAAPLLSQVPNPVSRFTTDNNGTAISLPSVSSSGATTVTGALYFGIGTQTGNGTESSNAMPSTATVLTLDTYYEQFITTSFNNVTNSQSYIDSGSNGLFFVDSAIPACTNTPSDQFASDWFCPSSTLSLSATNTGATGSSGSSTVSFSVANTDTLFNANNGLDTAFSNLGGPGTSGTFDWGLPFFYGRVVYSAIEGNSVANSNGTTFTGPFVAY